MPPKMTDSRIGDHRIRRGPSANPLLEYVSGGQYGWLKDYARALHRYIDEISRDFGDDIYERMLLDPQLASCFSILRRLALRNGLSISSRIKEPTYGSDEGKPVRKRGEASDREDFETGEEIAEFCRRAVAGLSRPLATETLWDMLGALHTGNRVAEIVYRRTAPGETADLPLLLSRAGDSALTLDRVKVKPRRTYAFVVDAMMTVLGLMVLTPEMQSTVLPGALIGRLDLVPNLLPRRKFMVLAFNATDEDPRGRSLARPAYNAWWLKQQAWPEYLKYVTQFGTPSFWGTTAPDAIETPKCDEDGEPVLDDDGHPVYLSPEIAMGAAVARLANGTYAIFPPGAELHPIEMSGNGEAFQRLFDLLNREMTKAVLGQTRATEEAQHGSKADSETGQDLLGGAVSYVRSVVERMIESDLLAPLVEFNYGSDYLRFRPTASLGDTASEDFSGELTALAGAGYALDPTQWPDIDARLGLPRRGENAIAQALDRQNKAPDATVPKDGKKDGAGERDEKEGAD